VVIATRRNKGGETINTVVTFSANKSKEGRSKDVNNSKRRRRVEVIIKKR
jgi:hypothetical protein